MAEETLTQNNDTSPSDHGTSSVVLDIESLAQSLDFCSGSPKMTRALSRKWSYRAERSISTDQEGGTDHESTKKLLLKVNSQLEPLKELKPLLTTESLPSTSTTMMSTNLLDVGDGRSKRLNRFMTINPRKILLIFATMSSMGTLILIYFTLAINRTVLNDSLIEGAVFST